MVSFEQCGRAPAAHGGKRTDHDRPTPYRLHGPSARTSYFVFRHDHGNDHAHDHVRDIHDGTPGSSSVSGPYTGETSGRGPRLSMASLSSHDWLTLPHASRLDHEPSPEPRASDFILHSGPGLSVSRDPRDGALSVSRQGLRRGLHQRTRADTDTDTGTFCRSLLVVRSNCGCAAWSMRTRI